MNRHALALAGLLVAAAVAPTAAPATAASSDGAIEVEAADHATVALHAPWSYDDGTGLAHHPDLSTGADPVEPPSVPGTVEWTASTPWTVYLQSMTWPHPGPDPGALHEQSEGLATPVDADRFTRVSMNVWSSRSATLHLGFFTCQEFTDECFGAMEIPVYAGWNLLTRNIVGDPDTDWVGDVYGVRLSGPGDDGGTRFRLDWLRLHEPAPVREYDTATGLLNWSTEGPTGGDGWQGPEGMTGGRVATGESVDVGAFPPGHYWIYEDNTPVDEFTVAPLPRPEILDPDQSGGEDYATARLRDPWDFDGPGDVVAIRNAAHIDWSDGVLSATNDTTGANGNDPHVILRLADDGLDPVHYHRLTVRTWYDGDFGLDDRTGNGTHGRVLWRTPQHPSPGDDDYDMYSAYSDGRELVFYTDQREYHYDLADTSHDPVFRSTAEPNVEPDGDPLAPPDPTWTAGNPITLLRFDPNEAPSPYRWYIDEIRLAADDAAEPTFDISWTNPATEPGTVATVRLDTDREGHDGMVLAEVEERPGVNTVTFDATDLLPQEFWVSVTSTAPDGRVGRTYASGPLQVGPRIRGSGRVETALALSRQSFRRADAAVIVSAGDFPDALASVALADALAAPLLLTATEHLSDGVLAELDRLGAGSVYIAGGEAAVGPAVAAALRDAGHSVERLGGRGRFETAALLASEAAEQWGRVDEVVVATGLQFPDALAAGPYLGAADVPLLLTAPDVAPPATLAALDALDPAEVVVLGGTGAVTDEVAGELAGDRPWRRIEGRDRWETARALASAAVGAGASPTDALIATGTNFPDALAAGAAALARGGILVLTAPSVVPEATADVLSDQGETWASWRVVGGPSAVSHAIVRRLQALSGL